LLIGHLRNALCLQTPRPAKMLQTIRLLISSRPMPFITPHFDAIALHQLHWIIYWSGRMARFSAGKRQTRHAWRLRCSRLIADYCSVIAKSWKPDL
jgi:hypothetical protein